MNRMPIDPEQCGALTNCDVVIFAGGSAGKQAESIGAAGLAAVRAFVENGGGYVGICAGACLATCGSPKTRLNLINAATISPNMSRPWRMDAYRARWRSTRPGCAPVWRSS